MSKRIFGSPNNDRDSWSHNAPATATATTTTRTLSSTRLAIEHKLASTAKKGSLNNKRSLLDPKDVVIQKRFGVLFESLEINGEGSKLLCAKDDVRVNYLPSNKGSTSTKQKSPRERSSSNSSSERSRRYNVRTSHREKSNSPRRNQSPEKIPYFSDARREEDRLRAKVEHCRHKRKKSQTPNRSRSKRRSRTKSRSADSRTRRRRRSRSRSRSSRRRYRSRSRSRSRDRRRTRSHSRRRTSSRDRHRDRSRRNSPYYGQGQLYIPVPYPVEHSCPGSWIPPMQPYHPRNPFMFRPSLPAPFYPVRQPFVPMGMYPRRALRFSGRHTRPYRSGPK